MAFVKTSKGFLKWSWLTSRYSSFKDTEQSRFCSKSLCLQITADVRNISRSIRGNIFFILNALFGTVNVLSHISYNDETWHSYTLLKEDPKNISTTWQTPWFLLTSAFFQRKSANFVISRNTDIDWISINNS